MKSHNLKDKLIGDKAFILRVVSIVLPMIIQNTVTNVVSLLDNVMVGQVGTLQMSAVAIVNQLIFIFNLCIFGGLAGAGIFATQYAGAEDTKGVRYCFRSKLVIALAMFIIAAVVFTVFPKPLVSMYLAEDTTPQDATDTLSFALSYLKIMLVGLLPFAITQVYSGTLRELGETKLPMISSVAAILVNLVFNYFLIFGKCGFPKLSVAGAAIATVMSRFVETAILVIAVHLKKEKYPFIKGVYKSLYVPMALCRDICTKGLPLLVNEFLWSLGMAIQLQCYSVRGLSVVAAVNIANTVNNLFNVLFLTMGNAVAIIIGQHLGANKIAEAKRDVWRLLFLAVSACVVVGGVMAALAGVIPNIYNTETEVKEMATQFLYVFAVLMPVFAFAHNCYFTLRSGGRTLITFAFDSLFTWGVVVPVAFILANYTTLPILPLYFIVQSIEVVKCVIGFIFVKKGYWIRNIISDTVEEPELES